MLNVLTYDSFTSEWGPGPAIAKGFEAECACTVAYVTAGDGAAVLSRLQMEGAGSSADIVLGLDTTLTETARATGLFAPLSAQAPNDLPVPYTDANFAPFDWGWFAFVHNKTLANPPKSFEELAASDLKIVIEDPRSSTPGLGLVMWVKAAYGDRAAEIWAGLKDNIVTVTPGWSEAYGLFLEGEADMVLSYTTSPAYHLIAESDDTKAAALLLSTFTPSSSMLSSPVTCVCVTGMVPVRLAARRTAARTRISAPRISSNRPLTSSSRLQGERAVNPKMARAPSSIAQGLHTNPCGAAAEHAQLAGGPLQVRRPQLDELRHGRTDAGWALEHVEVQVGLRAHRLHDLPRQCSLPHPGGAGRLPPLSAHHL